ncbi:MAG TPA: hypothetical protein VK421_11060 [Pyrinomonadaceae bacterium]|nr:hypothetical protein [Pyrinomonadaceae bacterium]
MSVLKDDSAASIPEEEFHLTADTVGQKSLAAKVWPVLLALVLTVGLLGGYFYLRGRNERALASRRAEAEKARAVAPPAAQIFQDEVRLAGGQAIVGGTVRNISGERLEGLSVEIELKSRIGDGREVREVSLEPRDLAQNEEGKYSLQVVPKNWSGVRVARLLSAARGEEIPFKPEMGARRPAEGRPPPKVVVEPRPRQKGDDFINTPDTPVRIP